MVWAISNKSWSEKGASQLQWRNELMVCVASPSVPVWKPSSLEKGRLSTIPLLSWRISPLSSRFGWAAAASCGLPDLFSRVSSVDLSIPIDLPSLESITLEDGAFSCCHAAIMESKQCIFPMIQICHFCKRLHWATGRWMETVATIRECVPEGPIITRMSW